LDDFGGEWAFYKRYCDLFKDKWGQWHKEGHSNTEELNDKLRSTCYVRRLKTEVLPELGERRSVPLWVEGEPKVMEEYWKAEEDIASYMAARAAEIAEELGENPRSAAVKARIKAEAAEHLVRMSALRRIAAKAKLKAVEELVSTHISEGSKVVIAAHHRDVVTGLADQYGGYMIIGGQDVELTERAKERFQNLPVDEVPVIVLSTQAAKTGHTLTAAQDIILVELPWTPADFDQVVDRLHRIGQEGSVLATSVLVPGTIDEWLWDLLAAKRKVVDAVTDGTPIVDDGGSVGDLLVQFAMKGLDAAA
jgi:SNF2 family DNA or RNA helicase